MEETSRVLFSPENTSQIGLPTRLSPKFEQNPDEKGIDVLLGVVHSDHLDLLPGV